MPERRFHLRVPIEFPVVLSGQRGRVDARASGLSCGGMAVHATGFERGEAISVAMLLPGSAAPTVVDARVAHVSPQAMGLSFEKIRSKDAQVIEEFVWQSLMPADDLAPASPAAASRAPGGPEADQPIAAPGARGGMALRVPLDVPVTLRRPLGTLEARATGLSPGGIVVRGAELEAGEQLEVVFSLPGVAPQLRVPGTVARKGKGIAGIRFVGMSHKELQELEATLWGFLRAAVRGPAMEPPAARPSPDRTENILAAIDESTAQAIIEGTRRVCEVEGCSRPHKARGMCARHYNQWRRRPK